MRYLILLNIRKYFVIFLLAGAILPAFSQFSVSIEANEDLLKNSITKTTIDDVVGLLKESCNCSVEINGSSAEVVLILPEIDSTSQNSISRFTKSVTYPYLNYPPHWYAWQSRRENGQIKVALETPSYQGISFGLYGLLQEQLGFKFYHPRETLIPNLKNWPLENDFQWRAEPKFDKKGFHHHTQHPLELTESFLYAESPKALENIKEFIDWIVRNQQNYFEFNLLESIDKKIWPQYAKQFVDYAHTRGILAGMEVSLHMIQQKAFKLYRNPPASFKKKKKQVKQNMEMLFAANWDIFNVEFASSEFTSGNIKKKQQLQLYIIDQLEKVYNSKLMGRMHVVKHDEELFGKGEKKEHEFTEEQKKIDQARGIMIHTVMFYTVFEENAPVYENDNLRHMLVAMQKEQQVRETWFYPESAYWVTFDNSVPMFLMPYLSSRLDDIHFTDSMKVSSHLTFSSGWEWGYWLFDWSIARWSWRHYYKEIEKNTPTQYIDELTKNETVKSLFKQSLDLQQDYFKDKNLIQYLTAQTATDELPGPGYIEFHPRPRWKYKWLQRKADLATIDTVKKEAIQPLLLYAQAQFELVSQLSQHLTKDSPLWELKEGLAITALRAQHRANTLKYLLSVREAAIKKDKSLIDHQALTVAKNVRLLALREVIERREAAYRYPIDVIARKRKENPTCYPFGYLYPVSNLHFWEREEQQAIKNNYSPFFMNIWQILRNMGIRN